MFDTDAEEINYILQMLKGNLEKFPTLVNENDDRLYAVGIYLTKNQTKLMINILENYKI